MIRPATRDHQTAGAEALDRALALLDRGETRAAEPLLRQATSLDPTLIEGWRRLADLLLYVGDAEEAAWAWRGLMQAADGEARPGLERLSQLESLLRRGLWRQALTQIDSVPVDGPTRRRTLMFKAMALEQLGDHAAATDCSASLLEDYPDQPKAWLMQGHRLRTLGRTDDAVAAYRKAVSLDPAFGDGYWALANLKTYRFTAQEREAMTAQLGRTDLGAEARVNLHFALAKADEDARRYVEAFDHYRQGNAIHHDRIGYDPQHVTEIVRRTTALLTPSFFAERAAWGSKSDGPIFIVGLPRSGSTLIDQVLASHPAVESLGELPDIAAVANWVSGDAAQGGRFDYPDRLRTLSAAQIERLGQAYLDRTESMRAPGRSYFTDKSPANFLHIAVILLTLPNARIIDARRHPLGCCLSAFKQHFGAGWDFSYDLADLGRYYADYTALMGHIDAVRPGEVHRVIYEQVVEDPEREIRRLLAYLDLPFDPACLRFYENDRAVPTPSSEQVRRPIFTDAVDQWTHFEPWLDPLKTALGPVLQTWAAER